MGFYLRKSFRAGPIRLNLSKSGLGISAGVKGLRVGTGPRGSYVHAGRGGLYFRQTLGNGGASATGSDLPRTYESDVIFTDTGVTYPTPVKMTSVTIPELPLMPQRSKGAGCLVTIAMVSLLALFGGWDYAWLAIPGVICLIAFIKMAVDNQKKQEGQKAIEELTQKFLTEVDQDQDWRATLATEAQQKLTLNQRLYFAPRALQVLAVKTILEGTEQAYTDLSEHKNCLNLSDEDFHWAKVRAFKAYFNEALKDFHLDETEERLLNQALDRFQLPPELVQEEMQTIKTMIEIRETVCRGLQPVHVDTSLQKGEVCYFDGQGRLLKSKILRQFTQNGVRHKETGFVIEKEGRLLLTSKRMLLVGDGVHSVNLDKILDVTLTHDRNLVEIAIDGRKTSAYYTSPDAIIFAALLQQAIQGETN